MSKMLCHEFLHAILLVFSFLALTNAKASVLIDFSYPKSDAVDHVKL